MIAPAEVPILILCGGMGTRFKEETEFRPKPMIEIGGEPIIVHIMRTYSRFGFRHFILCMGYKSHCIMEYFMHYYSRCHDATIETGTNRVHFHERAPSDDWLVTLAHTGEATMTGARVARAAQQYLRDAPHFGVTYGDGLADADLGQEWSFHCSHAEAATVLGVRPPSRFGEFELDGDLGMAFQEKPEAGAGWINGGYFFFRRRFLEYLSPDESCILERAPLARAARERQLRVFCHSGFWACMDTQRDRDQLNALWHSGRAPWAAPEPKVLRKGATS